MDALRSHRQPASEPPLDLKVRAAWLYYVEGLKQQEIARAMRISRAKVARLLAAARDEGVVTIQVGAQGGEEIALERRLVERFGLDEARVVAASADERDVAAAVGRAAGRWLDDNLHDRMSVGVGWGATLSVAASVLAGGSRNRLAVVSLLGGMTHSRGVDPSAVARRIADAFTAECYQLTAPLIVASNSVRDGLWTEPGLAQLRRRAERLDVALVSVGDVSEDATLFREALLPRSHLVALRNAGAVGDVLGQFVDRGGNVVDHPARQRVVAVDLEILRRVPRVAIASGGQHKVEALRAALRATGARVLITDAGAARGLVGNGDARR